MTSRATGTFDVKTSPLPLAAAEREGGMGRMLLEKQYHGDLDATSTGEMLTGMGDVPGSAGYVAIERVEGTLGGRRGGFLLQHSGIMDCNIPTLTVRVIPDSGTGELTGLTGTLTFRAEGKWHDYVIDYTVPSPG